MSEFDFSTVRGFNYQPSYGSTSLENWYYFKPELFELELRRGKQYFPQFNTVRYWLSRDAFIRKPRQFVDNFETALRIADSLGLRVIVCLINRWHNDFLDNGGVYLDNIIPGWGWAYGPQFYKDYFDIVMGEHQHDKRILAWDLCNEPFPYRKFHKDMGEIPEIEFAWLKEMYDYAKTLGISQPVSFGSHPMNRQPFEERETWFEKCAANMMDIIMIHPYYMDEQNDSMKKAEFEKQLDSYVALAKKQKKGIIATETCWGSLDDTWRVENIRYTMGELKKRGIGIIPHALHHSLVADLHLPEYGPVGIAGNMCFINADGSLRRGHEVFNEF